MIVPEVRTVIERAAAAREQLAGLLAVLPAGYWGRAAPGDAWRVHDHAAHVAAADEIVAELLRDADRGQSVWLGGTDDPAALATLRERRMASFANGSAEAVLASMSRARAAVVDALTVLDPAVLDVPLYAAGVANAWGQPVRFTVRTYLAQWATHDLVHAACIREAIRQPLTPGDIAAGARLRR